MKKIAPWQQKGVKISRKNLLDVFANKCAYVSVENFIIPEDCTNVINTLRGMGLQQYDYNFNASEAPPASHLFATHYLYESKQPEEYFHKAQESIIEYQKMVIGANIDPVKLMMDLLSRYLKSPVFIANQNGCLYSYVIARELNHSVLLHADFAQAIPSYWSISNVVAQYAWNVYLTDPGQGGETIIYNKPWQPKDDEFSTKNTYGYDHAVVKGAEFIKFKPRSGMLMFFNSRNFHEVAACTQPRLTLGGHVGITSAGEFIIWV